MSGSQKNAALTITTQTNALRFTPCKNKTAPPPTKNPTISSTNFSP